ncbi:hypothetical protein GGI26_005555 [Coemansia sp. RSA 1358]|nr:hypothetical protein GGI26_005555 [Coemansia sp. RSA 1358]
MGEPTDEGFDDYPLHMYSPQQPKRAIATPAGYQLPIKVTDIQLMESLARTLKISVSSEACAHLAVLLLSHAPADMLKMTMQRLDLLLRRDFIGMLPLEISTRILEYVPIIDIVKNASFVSRQWYAATTQPCLWHRLFRRQGWGIDKERWALYYSLPCSLTSKQPVDWRKLYSEYHRLLVNWRDGKCRVDRWESAHAESVYCLQFDQNNRLFTGSRDRTVKLWHLSETGSQIVPLATLKGHSGSVLTLQADDNTLITGSSDGTMCIWSMDTYTIVHRLVHPDSVLSLRFNDKWLATACKDRVVRVWRRDQGYKDVFELLGHAVAINAIHLYEDTLVSASGDRTIKIWDLKTRTCVQTLADHTRGVACLDFDGTYIVSGSSDRSIRIWDAVTGACQRVIHNAHTDLVRTVMFNRKQDILVSGSYDESIKIWSLSTGALMHKIKNVHTSRVFKLMFDRSRIISCSHDRSVSIIDFAAELEHARLLL